MLQTYKNNRSSQASFSPEPTKDGKRKDENRTLIDKMSRGGKLGGIIHRPQSSRSHKHSQNTFMIVTTYNTHETLWPCSAQHSK